MDFELIEKLEADQLFGGCDEVGRGPLAGPVVAATAAISGRDKHLLKILQEMGVTDSKKLTAKRRKRILSNLGIELEDLAPHQLYTIAVNNYSLHFCIGEVSPTLIDEINILNASLKAMSICSNICIDKSSGILLVDGNRLPSELPLNCDSQAIVKGDSRSIIIGIASIIAKEYRDYLMEQLDQKYPGYGLKDHAGYPTKKHLESIKILGPTPIHRKSFKGVKEYF